VSRSALLNDLIDAGLDVPRQYAVAIAVEYAAKS
jgi:hypothetical protein